MNPGLHFIAGIGCWLLLGGLGEPLFRRAYARCGRAWTWRDAAVSRAMGCLFGPFWLTAGGLVLWERSLPPEP